LASWRMAWQRCAAQLVPNEPIDWNVPLDIQLSPLLQSVLEVLAVERLGSRRLVDPAAWPQLACEIRAGNNLPSLGSGPVTINEIGDVSDPVSGTNAMALNALRKSVSGRFAWRWIHGPAHIEHAGGKAACFLEAYGNSNPSGFWNAVYVMQQEWQRVRTGNLADLPIEINRQVVPVIGAEWGDAAKRDAAALNAAGAPTQRPAFAVGRIWFDGIDAIERFIASESAAAT